MSTTGRSESSETAAVLAGRLRSAAFVRVAARPSGDALAAAGLLGRACAATDTPFQLSLPPTRGAAVDALAPTADADGDAAVAIGFDVAVDATVDGDLVATVRAAVTDLGVTPDAALALAGVRAAGRVPGGDVADAADRRLGVGLPVADLADGLAHATAFHADWSGDDRHAGALLTELNLPAELDDDAWRRLASRVALDATQDASPASVGALDRVLRPHVLPDGPFETAEGYADVLDCLAVSDPGLACALALGAADRTDALETYREHATATHAAFDEVDPSRYSGFVVCEVDRPAWPLARLVREARSPEPAALVVGSTGAALATARDGAHARDTLAAAVGDVDAVAGSATRATTPESDAATLREGLGGAL